MSKTTPIKFIREVRQEISKVTWPTRKETMVTTAMVFVMVLILSLFFFRSRPTSILWYKTYFRFRFIIYWRLCVTSLVCSKYTFGF